MIAVSDLLQWTMGKLELSVRAGHKFSLDQFFREVNDAVTKLGRKYWLMRKTEEFELPSDGICRLSTDTRPIQIISIVTPWEFQLKPLKHSEMREYKQQLSAVNVRWPYSWDYTQPVYWYLNPNEASEGLNDPESPGAYVEIQDASVVTPGSKIVITYSYIPRKKLRAMKKDATLDIGEEYELLFKLYVGWQTAIRYRPDLVQELRAQYAQEVQDLQADHKRRLHGNQPEYTDHLPY